jgi:hypothetical protein
MRVVLAGCTAQLGEPALSLGQAQTTGCRAGWWLAEGWARRDAQVHDAMSVLKMNLRQEHWETLSYASTCTQLMTPWQMATLLVESHPFWCAPLTHCLCTLPGCLD